MTDFANARPSAFAALPGAVLDESLGVASHYGSPLPEQRALEAGNAIVDLGHRDIITVSGEDRLSWLHSFTSQDIASLSPGVSVETLLLDANGRIQHAIRLVDDGERAWLLVDEGSAETLVAYLNRMRFALRVEVADVSADFQALLVFAGGEALPQLRHLGTDAPGAEARTAVVEWHDPWGSVAPGGAQYALGEHPAANWSATHVVVPRAELPAVTALISAGTVSAAGLLALDALEIRAWRPTRHGEVDERAIAHELDWLRSAVHLTKGCYRGQETVAKVHNLGRPPRRVVLLHLDGSGGQLPQPRALVYRAGESAAEGAKPVGRVTRVGLHHEWGGIALAMLKRAVPEDAALEVVLGDPDDGGGLAIAATQEIIVPADAGRAKDIPRLRRL